MLQQHLPGTGAQGSMVPQVDLLGCGPGPACKVCVCGGRLVCSSLLAPCSSFPLPLAFHLPILHLPLLPSRPPRPRRPSPWALPLRITLPVPRQLCAFTGAARWGEGGREARDQELQEAGRTLRALSGQFNEIMKVKCFIPPGAHSGRLISLCLVPPPGVWRKQGSESGWGASEGT